MNTKSDTQAERKAKSFEMKTANAQKARLNDLEKQLYLQKYVSLGKAKDFVQKGNQGKGFRLREWVLKKRFVVKLKAIQMRY